MWKEIAEKDILSKVNFPNGNKVTVVCNFFTDEDTKFVQKIQDRHTNVKEEMNSLKENKTDWICSVISCIIDSGYLVANTYMGSVYVFDYRGYDKILDVLGRMSDTMFRIPYKLGFDMTDDAWQMFLELCEKYLTSNGSNYVIYNV